MHDKGQGAARLHVRKPVTAITNVFVQFFLSEGFDEFARKPPINCLFGINLNKFKKSVKRRDTHGVLPLHKAAERCGARMEDLLISGLRSIDVLDSGLSRQCLR